MRRLLVITGDLATGKSTFSEILSERYHVNVFTKDKIKEILADTIGFADREENLKLSGAAVELLTFLFSSFTKLGGPLILEANFHREELERLQEMAAASHYEVLVLVLRGDLSVLHRRYLNRMQNENRHPAHLSNPIDQFEHFKKYTESARAEGISGNIIRIDATDLSYQTDEALLAKLDRFMEFKN